MDRAFLEPPATGQFVMYGLRVRSEFGLPGWPAIESDRADVLIRRESLSGPEVQGGAHATRWVVEDGALSLAVQTVGRYRASGGALIQVDPVASARPEDIELYLTGAMIGAVLHQRGVFPLHASCVDLDGSLVAFAGPSGAGKSTLVATLVEAGAGFWTDDASVLDLGTGGGVSVWPGPPRMKLDDRSMAVLSPQWVSRGSAGGTAGKFQIPVESPVRPVPPICLKRVYFLVDGDGPPRIEPLSALEATSLVVDHTHFLAFAMALGLMQQVFRLAAMVAGRTRASRLVRPRGLDHLSATVGLIQSDSQRT